MNGRRVTRKFEPGCRIAHAADWPDNYLGTGVFETMRTRNCGTTRFIAAFNQHCERFLTASNYFKLPVPTFEQLYELTAACLAEKAVEQDSTVRFLARPDGVFVFAEDYAPHAWLAGARLGVVSLQRSLPEFKACSALTSVFAQQRAQEAGYDVALLCDPDGSISECAWASFFWLDEAGVFRTRESGVLPGITRSLVRELWEVRPGLLTRADISAGKCRAAFITQATSGIVPVTSIDDGAAFSAAALQQMQCLQVDFLAALTAREELRTTF